MAGAALATPHGVGQTAVAGASAAPTATTLSTTRNPTYNAQSGFLSARVRGNAAYGVPTGAVEFFVDGASWSIGQLDAYGRSRLAYRDIPVGSHVVSAVYAGDGNYDTSTSGEISQTVLATAPMTSVTYTPSAVSPGAVSRLVVMATNTTPVGMPTLGMGLTLPPGAAIVSVPPGVGCRAARPSLFYCVTSASPGTSRRIVIDVTAPAAPTTITTYGYARNLDTMDETGASARLTVG